MPEETLDDLDVEEVFLRRLAREPLSEEQQQELLATYRKRSRPSTMTTCGQSRRIAMQILQIRFLNLNSLAGEWQIDLTDPALYG